MNVAYARKLWRPYTVPGDEDTTRFMRVGTLVVMTDGTEVTVSWSRHGVRYSVVRCLCGHRTKTGPYTYSKWSRVAGEHLRQLVEYGLAIVEFEV